MHALSPAEGFRHFPAAGAEVGLVHDEARGAVCGGELGQAHAADHHLPAFRPAGGAWEDVGRDEVELLGGGGAPAQWCGLLCCDRIHAGLPYILSGADTPTRLSAFSSTWRVAAARARRAWKTGAASAPVGSSAFGSTWQAS